MKKNKSLNKLILVFIALIMCVSPVMSGCFSLNSIKLDTPEIILHSESQCITWDSIVKSKEYDIYLNDTVVDTVTNKVTLSSYVYDFSDLLGDSGDYVFHIVAVANTAINESSDASNQVTYTYTKTTPSTPGVEDTVIGESSSINIPFVINGSYLDFIPVNNSSIDSYEMYLYSTSTGLNTYPVSLNIPTGTDGYRIDLLNSVYNLQDEIYAVRLGVVIDDEHMVASELKYINPDAQTPYTSEVYLFDGYINDMYIESLQELRNLVYYMFASRTDTQNIHLSPNFRSLIQNYSTTYGTEIQERLSCAIADCFDYFYETRDGYSISCLELTYDGLEFCISFNFDDSSYLNTEEKPEPELTVVPTTYYYEDIDWTTYYDSTDKTLRVNDSKYVDEEFDSFVSDNQFLYQEVSSSEELYWAVENRVTPICETGSRAETIYNIAKDVLRNIISDDMTDYEKALSIFDWICKETSYDYDSLSADYYSGIAATLTPGYYLEGVFMTGYAVCDGFSKAYSLLCNMEGIECIRIVGDALAGYDAIDNEVWGGHAWNKVALDVSDTDNVGAQYYVVDITWTELRGSTWMSQGLTNGEENEVSSHMYFLVGDAEISGTHRPFANRTKFANYDTGLAYDYYAGSTYTFNPESYGVTITENKTTYDMKIESDDDLASIFYYLLVSGRESVEVLLTYDYISDIVVEAGVADYNTAIQNKMRSKKFNEQYVFLNSSADLNDEGIIYIMENNLLIDADNEVGHLVEFLSHYEIYNSYDLYVSYDMISQATGTSDIARVQNMFASALASSNIDMTFELVENSNQVNNTDAHFKITIREKSA